MIKTNELRIGNLVRVPNTNQSPFRIDCIEHLFPKDGFGKFGMFLDGFENSHPITWYLKDLSPIPLTEEWLVRLGFEKKNGYGYKIFGNWLQKEDSVFWYNVNGNFIEINFVHQLQNLYFALTGEELNERSQ